MRCEAGRGGLFRLDFFFFFFCPCKYVPLTSALQKVIDQALAKKRSRQQEGVLNDGARITSQKYLRSLSRDACHQSHFTIASRSHDDTNTVSRAAAMMP